MGLLCGGLSGSLECLSPAFDLRSNRKIRPFGLETASVLIQVVKAPQICQALEILGNELNRGPHYTVLRHEERSVTSPLI